MSETVVVDSSLAMRWIMEQEYSNEALALLKLWANQGTNLLVPELFASEVSNALYKHVRIAQEITIGEAERLLEDLLGMVNIALYDPKLAVRAIILTHELDRPATYDSFYIALAEREGCPLWTANERFHNAVRGTLPFVRWIGNWPIAAV